MLELSAKNASAGPEVLGESNPASDKAFKSMSSTSTFTSPGIKVLLVEDMIHDAELITMELDRSGVGFHCRRVDNRDEFLQELAGFTPDVILADYALPSFSALDALALLREHGLDIPLILVTGSNSEEVAVRCMRAGAEDYILKSSLKRLPAAVQNTITKRLAERERKATEQALRRSEEQYRLITENTRDLVSLLDLNFAFLYASPSFQIVLGHQPSQMIGMACADWLHPGDHRLLKETLDEALFFREARHAELRFRHSNQSWLTFEVAASYIFDEQGRPQRALLVCRDTGDRKRAEREIRKLAAFPRFNPNPVLEFAADGSLTYFNDAALEMARSLRRNHPQSILPLNVANIVKMCLATGQAKLHMDTNICGRVISWSFFPVVANQVVHCYAEDVTDRVNLEADLRQAQKMESVGQLAAGVAHDFNNLLTIIQGHSGLLSEAPNLASDLTESVRQITFAAERAANLTRQLLMFSRKQVMQPQLLNLNEVIHNLTKVIRTLVGAQITFERSLMDELPPIHADPGMMEQILVNLSVNARDAMPRGGTLTIATRFTPVDPSYVKSHAEATPGNYVRLTVTDTGHGMDRSTISRIFEPFFTTKEIGKGTGLGLSTVYGIVKQHQGWIEVDSEVGKGASFSVYVPVATRAEPRNPTTRVDTVPGGNETILVVEDEEALRELVSDILQRKGYTVLEAQSGDQAMEVWQSEKERIDLLLTDMMMPGGLSGRDVAERLLADRPELKVIYTSGYSIDTVTPEALGQDAMNFLQKPYDPETLAQMVRNILNGVPAGT